MQPKPRAGKMQPVPSAGKHVAGAKSGKNTPCTKRGKTRNHCQGGKKQQEKQQAPSAGIHATGRTGFKRGENVTGAKESRQRLRP